MGIQQENKQIRELQQENKGKVFGLLWGLTGTVTNHRGLEVAQWLRALEHPGSVPGSSELPLIPSQGCDTLFGVTRHICAGTDIYT